MMARKDYKLLAETINKVTGYVHDPSMRALIRSEFYEMLTANYKNFDALKFYEALDLD